MGGHPEVTLVDGSKWWQWWRWQQVQNHILSHHQTDTVACWRQTWVALFSLIDLVVLLVITISLLSPSILGTVYVGMVYVDACLNAMGVIHHLWATPVIKNKGLFFDKQLDTLASNVKVSLSKILKQRCCNSSSRW